jgi:hypothetical protein
MANKPDKCRIIFLFLVDLKTKYVINGSPCLGKDKTKPENESLSYHVVKQLCQSLLLGGFNITTDNFFTSLSITNVFDQ